jgi:hypothetical protein
MGFGIGIATVERKDCPPPRVEEILIAFARQSTRFLKDYADLYGLLDFSELDEYMEADERPVGLRRAVRKYLREAGIHDNDMIDMGW